jgi:hypothetical protein
VQERHDKLYPAITGLGQQGRHQLETSELAQDLINNPNFYSGVGAPLVEAWKKFAAALGGDPNAAAPMEAFRKITASNINDQITGLREATAAMGSGQGRIFELQARKMEQASQNIENTPAGNKFLADMQHRMAIQNKTLGDMAIDYTQKYGLLDAGFDKKVNEYLDSHPLYDPKERSRLLITVTKRPGEAEGQSASPPRPEGAPAGARLGKDPQGNPHWYAPEGGGWRML